MPLREGMKWGRVCVVCVPPTCLFPQCIQGGLYVQRERADCGPPSQNGRAEGLREVCIFKVLRTLFTLRTCGAQVVP